MTFLRYAIYAGGGLLVTALYLVWVVWDTMNATKPWVLWTLPVLAFVFLYIVDRWIHSALFGFRIEFRPSQYVPCSICPFRGGEAHLTRTFVFSIHCFGPVHAVIEHRLPVLISEEAATELPKPEIDKIPGFHVIRFSSNKAVLYIRDKQYYDAFIAANEQALI